MESDSYSTMNTTDGETLHVIKKAPSSTNIYSRYQLPSHATSTGSLSESPIIDHKRNYTMEDLNSLAYFSTFEDTPHDTHIMTPSAAIRDRYYRSSRYLHDSGSDFDEEDTLYEEENIDGDILDYRPEDSTCYPKPEVAPSIYSSNGSIISLRTEFNDREDGRSITSIRTVDDRLQGRSITSNINSFASKTAKKVSRSGTLFRSKNSAQPKITVKDDDETPRKKKLEPFVPVRDIYPRAADNLSVRTAGGTSLLSKLSKSTAPMRAKLSAFSGLTKNHRMESLGYLGRKRGSESVYNLPISSPSYALTASTSTGTHHLYRRQNDKALSINTFPPTLSASSSSSSSNALPPIMSSVLVEEPSVLPPIPHVYPALLSQVAQAFQDVIVLTTKKKDSIKYKDVFDGKEAVDKLALILKSTDRNLALLLGRALDSQKFFHDVNYEHRLRDSNQELYQFREQLNMRPLSANFSFLQTDKHKTDSSSEVNVPLNLSTGDEEKNVIPTGVFTPLTDCYSSTCTGDNLCYSSTCPRRQEQQKKKAIHRGHSRDGSVSYLVTQEDRLWINTVPKSVINTLSKDEIKRQENIYELIYTEKDFVDDLTYVKEQWIQPLLSETADVDSKNIDHIVETIFWNILEVLEVNMRLSKALLERQSDNPIVNQVGDIMLTHVALLEPFVRYGAHQIIGRYTFESEKSSNASFALFVEKTERLPQSRKLELNGYLTKPTTRLGRYNLLLREILKHTPKDHPDQQSLPKAMATISNFLSDVNRETGKAENKFNLDLLNERLVNKNISNIDLDLLSDNRQIIMKGVWKKGSGSEASDVLVYLLDHCLLIMKSKFSQNEERYKLYKKPIPLALLSISFPDQTKRASTIIPLGRPTTPISFTASSSTGSTDTLINTSTINKNGYPISFVHLDKQKSAPVTLYAPTLAGRKQWAEKIEEQRKTLVEKHKVFNVLSINKSFFSSFNRVNCLANFEGSKSLLMGGDQGVYLKKEGSGDELIRILAMDKVSQIDILEQANLILVLADKILYTYSLDTLLSFDSNLKRSRKISRHVSFFKVGKVNDRTVNPEEYPEGVEKTLVCFVRFNAMTSTIRALEPCETPESKKKNKNFGRLRRGNNEGLKAYKDLYIPGEASSIQFFKNVICVGSPRGFQMVNLSSAEVQSVLDPNDESNEALLALHENAKPVSMFRHKDGNILLCYTDLAFYIDKKGKRAKEDWFILWEGNPTAFAFRFPYVVAFSTNFIEVRHMNTGDLLQVIPGNNIRCLRPDSTDAIHGVMEDRLAGSEIIFELKLVDSNTRKISMIKHRNEKR